jgi:hypothetical protein
VRGSSLPLDAMLGVAMERESEMPVCASIRCKASSVQIQNSRWGRGNTRKSTDEKDLELWVAQSTCFYRSVENAVNHYGWISNWQKGTSFKSSHRKQSRKWENIPLSLSSLALETMTGTYHPSGLSSSISWPCIAL